MLNKNYPTLVLIVFLNVAVSFWPNTAAAKERLPYFKEVMKIMAPLEYSGFKYIVAPDAKLDIDFNAKVWVLNNTRQFNSKGKILLDSGGRGLCYKLSRYVYDKIRPIFPKDRFDIEFAITKEKNYFDTEDAKHVVLLIVDKRFQKKYLIDPSFKKYGKKDDFKEYSDFSEQDGEVFKNSNQWRDSIFQVDHATPVLIRKGYLVTFSVESAGGVFDKNNFILAIAATKAQASTGTYLFAIRYSQGQARISTNDVLLRELLTPGEVLNLEQRLIDWMDAAIVKANK